MWKSVVMSEDTFSDYKQCTHTAVSYTMR